MTFLKSLIFILLTVTTLLGCTDKAAPSDFLNYHTKTNLGFPLRGESLIVWGGRTIEQNAHASEKDQRFAMDIVALKQGSTPPQNIDNAVTYDGAQSLNDSYYIYGRDVIAPANGVIVDTFDGVLDAIPSESHFDFEHPAGNYVVIDHGNSEFSMIAHLQKGSVVFRKGDRVLKGETVGLVGNSGNSSEPHLHYHLQNTSVWSNGDGLPAQFQNYIANGRFIQRGEPVRGQMIISN